MKILKQGKLYGYSTKNITRLADSQTYRILSRLVPGLYLSRLYQPPENYGTDYCSDCLGVHRSSASVS